MGSTESFERRIWLSKHLSSCNNAVITYDANAGMIKEPSDLKQTAVT